MSVKGTVIKSINQYVKEEHPDKYDQWINSLAPKTKEIFSNLINVSTLYDVEDALIESSNKVSDMFFKDREEGAWALGKYSSEKSLRGIYKAFVIIATPAFVIGRAGLIMKTLYVNTEMIIVDKSSKSVTTEVRNLPNNHFVLENRIGGWIEKTLEITGCKNIKIDVTQRSSKGDGVTRYEVTWS